MAVNEISGFLKFKDSSGDINLLLPITTKDNVDGLDEIENELANSVKVVSQTLTDAQKTQARENIGAASSSHSHGDEYCSKEDLEELVLITPEDIDAICGTTIQMASEVTF